MTQNKRNKCGYKFVNARGCKGEIIRYVSWKEVYVRFEGNGDNEIVKATFDQCKTGKVKNPNFPLICGVGFIGFGDFKATDENGKITKCYSCWSNMIKRCYDDRFKEKQPTYNGCYVCSEWHNFQNFAKWYDENYYEIKHEKINLDKDLLYKNNKMYSKETCIFIPNRINELLTKRQNFRGVEPIGVRKVNGKFISSMTVSNKKVWLGTYNTKEEAFASYKNHKEKTIREVAEEYKNKIPKKAYEALISYEVNIED